MVVKTVKEQFSENARLAAIAAQGVARAGVSAQACAEAFRQLREAMEKADRENGFLAA